MNAIYCPFYVVNTGIPNAFTDPGHGIIAVLNILDTKICCMRNGKEK
uniref:Uncharacterized protein n=1 Tax=Anguilla anguilla TaxID=7936 RepID=A0A0E9TNX1_ANGAN